MRISKEDPKDLLAKQKFKDLRIILLYLDLFDFGSFREDYQSLRSQTLVAKRKFKNLDIPLLYLQMLLIDFGFFS